MNSFRQGTVRATRLAVLLLLLAPMAALSAPAQGRVVAIGDIHGDCDAFVGILQKAGLVGSKTEWSGGKATLVQTGDSLDRGPKPREVLDLLMALEKQAPKKGGKVIVLLGNHEVMNMTGDLRDVTPANFASYADDKSEKRRHSAYEAFVTWSKGRAQRLGQPEPVFDESAEAAWMKTHPAGFVEHREAFAPEGKYGKWLRAHAAVAQVGDSIFLHGGINPLLASWKVSDLNARVRDELSAYDRIQAVYLERKVFPPNATLGEAMLAAKSEVERLQSEYASRGPETFKDGKLVKGTEEEKVNFNGLAEFLLVGNWLMMHPDGPLWFRGYATWGDAEGETQAAALTKGLGVAHLVVGHTPLHGGRITPRFGGKIFLIDTGMLSSYFKGGRSSALEIRDGKFTAIYQDEQIVLLDPVISRPRPSAEENLQDAGEIPGGGVAELEQGAQGATAKAKPAEAQQAPAKTPSKQKKPATPPAETVEPAATVEASPRLAPTQSRANEPSLVVPKQAAYPDESRITKTAPASAPAAGPAFLHHVWLGPDGKPSPLQDTNQILEFLRTAKAVSSKTISTGISQPRKIKLEKNGLVLNAIFRDVRVEKDMARMATGTTEMFFRDDFIFECAAFELARMLGLDNVPPVVHRTMQGEDGSMQIWLENVMMETRRQKEKIIPPDVHNWNRQVQVMRVFDNLVYNTDRNTGNIMIDSDWKLWMVDHTRAFRRTDALREPVGVVQCERGLWEKMKTMTQPELQQHLRPYLRGVEIDAIYKRRTRMLDYLQKLIAEKGEDKVLFDWDK